MNFVNRIINPYILDYIDKNKIIYLVFVLLILLCFVNILLYLFQK